MNNIGTMYELKPIYKLPDHIQLPTCMYTMRSIINDKITDQGNENRNDILNNLKDKKPLPELAALTARWDTVLKDLSNLTAEVNEIKMQLGALSSGSSCSSKCLLDKRELQQLKILNGAVINVNPMNPPYSLFLIKQLCGDFITISSHVHSSVNGLPQELEKYCKSESNSESIKIVLIWKEGTLDGELVMNPVRELSIRGEVNVLRHLGRLGMKMLRYPSDDIYQTTQIDSILDVGHRLLHTEAAKEKASLYRNLNAKLGRNQYFGGDSFNICDLSIWSIMKQIRVNLAQDVTPNMVKWFQRMDDMLRV